MTLYLPCFVGIFLILPSAIIGQTSENIMLGFSLTAGDTSSPRVSPSDDFAFGFQEIQPGNYLLAIWFNVIPERTILWSANRDRLAPSGSKVELTNDKGLVLTDPRGQELWRAKLLSGGTPAYAALLDTGNLVLSTQASVVLWQSFDHPTDTLLPTQTLNKGSQLIARYSEHNFSSGRFSFQLSTSGNLSLYTTDFPLFNSLNSRYWDYENQGLGFQVIFNQSRLLYLIAHNGSIIRYMFPEDRPSEHVPYQRVILEHDGVLRHYVYPLSTGWSVKSFAPDNICTAVMQRTGSGVCGYNSYCQFGDDRKPHCLCPPGYSLIDPNYEMGGCDLNFQPQSCQNPTHENNEFHLEVLNDVDWPLCDYEHFQNVSIGWCRQVCLDDCFCAVGIFNESGDCWKKKLPLSNGKSDESVDRTAFIKVRTSDDFSDKYRRKSDRVLIALLSTSGVTNIILLGAIIVGICFFVYRKKVWIRRQQSEVNRGTIGDENMESCLELSLNTIRAATSDFSDSNKLGEGGFGAVYKGRLPNGDLVAVKRLTRHTPHGDLEFKNEVQLVAKLQHKNLTRLLGFSLGVRERILIYELAPNGSLDQTLFDPIRKEHLHWKNRHNIIKGVARGLLYLPEESQYKIIHRDLKASNVLLDESMNAKISDFGTARLYVEDYASASKIVGTYGYMAPEYAKYGRLSTKVDVFSFGVLLLEIISGTKNNNASRNPKQIEHLLSKAWKYWTTGEPMQLVDAVLLCRTCHAEEITRCIHIGLLCVQEVAQSRPSMSQVAIMLDYRSQSLPSPSKPAFLMNAGDDEGTLPTMEDNYIARVSEIELGPHRLGMLPSSSHGFSSVNEISFTRTFPDAR